MEMDADRLAQRSKMGDREAFGRLYELFAKRIYAYLYYRTLCRETAEDLTSAVFIGALEGLEGFRPELGGFSAWIYSIARNALTDHFRRSARILSVGDFSGGIWDLPDGTDLELEAQESDRWERLKPYLAGLSGEQREIVILRLWDGLSYREIAGMLGKSEGACKMAYSRALSLLRASMPLSLFIAFLAAKPPIG
jgi:RNA polymerase sigma factor (sigma-70 family)